MKSPFPDRHFLLGTKTAVRLYEETARELPIIDYHCHIPPAEIAENRRFENITRAWLEADHYKWRAMRACGVPERLITGDADDEEKFRAYAACMPLLIGNPLYHWSHLELSRYFGCDIPLNPGTAGEIWNRANDALAALPARAIIERSNVQAICTTDDPADSLEHHRALREDAVFAPAVLPAFRPDRALAIEHAGFPAYIGRLGAAAGLDITSFDTLAAALAGRMDAFDALGCRAADHGLTRFPLPGSGIDADTVLQKRLYGGTPDSTEADAFRWRLLLFLAREYRRRDWVMEIHFGALRNTRARMYRALGPDSGFDNMGAEANIPQLTAFMDTLDGEDALPRTLLFSINPADNAPLCTLCGAFGERVQQGSAWWFNDTLHGMRDQLTAYASLLPLGKFIGFLTDSRSFLSYTRHEYFRRLLCAWIGERVENGEYPGGEDALDAMIRGVCHDNAQAFFRL